MRTLVKKLLDQDLSRRAFGQNMMALGFSSAAIDSILSAVAYAQDDSTEQSRVERGKEFVGSGGEIVAECLVAADVEYVFDANSSGQVSFYDALGSRPEIELIVALHEGQGVSMAQGYELASGKTAVLFLPGIGMPNAMSNLYNAWKDRSSLVVFSDGRHSDLEGRDGFQQVDDWLQPTEAFTKWRWQVNHADRLAEMIRRSIKLAGTPPGGPVYLRVPEDVMGATDIKQTIYPQSDFRVSLDMEPKSDLIDQAADLLVNAENPVINIGGEVTRAGAKQNLIELAELLAFPIAQGLSVYSDFPFGHPLFAGNTVGARPPAVRRSDVFLNIGSNMPDPTMFGSPVPEAAKVINARVEYDKIANTYPTELAIAAGTKETIRALIDSIQSKLTQARIETIKNTRWEAAQIAHTEAAERRRAQAAPIWNDSPIVTERLAYALEDHLAEDAIIVTEPTGRRFFERMDFGPGKKTAIGPTTGFALGWNLGAALGAKIARPDSQVVCLVGDGSMMFGQVESLWMASRYDIPIIIIVLNNRSYNSERLALYSQSKLAASNKDLWKDMSCYLGDPNIDFVNIAKSFDIDGQFISAPDEIGPAMERASAVTREGRPYLIEALTARYGAGAESTWHPEISIAAKRTRKI